MLRTRWLLFSGVLALVAGCQSFSDRPLMQRWFGNNHADCCDMACPCPVYDGPVLPDSAMMPPINGTLTPPTPIGPAPAIVPGTQPQPLRPVPQAQPVPYSPQSRN